MEQQQKGGWVSISSSQGLSTESTAQHTISTLGLLESALFPISLFASLFIEFLDLLGWDSFCWLLWGVCFTSRPLATSSTMGCWGRSSQTVNTSLWTENVLGIRTIEYPTTCSTNYKGTLTTMRTAWNPTRTCAATKMPLNSLMDTLCAFLWHSSLLSGSKPWTHY